VIKTFNTNSLTPLFATHRWTMATRALHLLLLVAVINADAPAESCGCGAATNRQSCPKDDSLKSALLPDKNDAGDRKFVLEAMGLNPMGHIPAGTFVMGTNTPIFVADREGPGRNVTLEEFYLDTHEVSNKEFQLFVQATGYTTEVHRIILK
jgi:Sulfatase-modifying factor enzyme 1